MKIFFLLGCLGIGFFSIPATGQEAESPSVFDESIQLYTDLRWEVFSRADYHPGWSNAEERDAAFALHSEEKWDEFLAASDEWLEQMPIDIQMHYVRSFVFLRLGRNAEFAKSFAIYTGLIASVMSEGDGKTPETAFPVTSTKEEYAVINEFRLQHIEQALVDPGVDRMTCKDEDGNEVILYFDVRKILGKYDELREAAE